MLASAFLIERVYRGELSLGNAGARHGGTARMLFSSPLGALLEKDVRSAWRDPALRASLFLGFLGPALILLFLSQARSQGGFGTTVLLLGSVVGLSAFSSNPLGLERRGIALLLGFPLPRPLVLVGRNLAALLFRLPGFLTLVVAGLFTPPALAVAALVVALATFFVAAGVDNFVSILFPVAAPAPGSNPYGSASGGRGLGAALVSSVFLLGALVISAPLAFLAWLPALLGRPWLWLGTLPLTLAGAGAVYAMLIAGAGRLLLRREPELLERILGEA
jgi:hypothetical protein